VDQLVACAIEQQHRHRGRSFGRSVTGGRPELPQAVGRCHRVRLAQGQPALQGLLRVRRVPRGHLHDGLFPVLCTRLADQQAQDAGVLPGLEAAPEGAVRLQAGVDQHGIEQLLRVAVCPFHRDHGAQ